MGVSFLYGFVVFMEQLFFVVAILVFVMGARGVSIATEISSAINYEGSGIELYYKIQND